MATAGVGYNDPTPGSNGRYSFDQLKQLWINYGGNPQNAAMAAAVALAESGGNPNAINKNKNSAGQVTSIDYGLWQINSKYNGGSPAYYDPVTNVKATIAISKNGASWRSWCSAYSDNRCGDRGGTYLGAGSNALKRLSDHGGGSTGSAPPGGANSGGGSSGGGGSSSGTAQPAGLFGGTVDQIFSYVKWYGEFLLGWIIIGAGIFLALKWAFGDKAPTVKAVIENAQGKGRAVDAKFGGGK